ncbi:LysR family transcriptional regulator [Halomonas garicola]|uniref:LysR family transcriptional regulator n=1 Tax=Halomonas garicola TaxID=1690008 RepID=UPI00289755EF|nr:LysR family transcriptional regulator [Halomonas garicola]
MRHFQPYVRHFVAVAEELHFRRAAERLHIAQPVLSRAVQQLEEKVGVVLLQRSRRHVALTAAGKLFLEECRAAQRIMERAERRAVKAHLGEMGKLVIGYTDFAINGRLPSILAAFHDALPAVDIDLVRRDSHEQLEDIASERLDMGFLTGSVSGNELQHYPVHQTPFVAVLPANHRLAALKAVPVKALAEEHFVLGEIYQWRHLVPQIQALCLQAGFVPKIAREAPNSDSIFGLVAAGMGVTLYPDCHLNYDRPGVVIRPLADNDTKLITEMAWLSNSTNPTVYRFIEITRALLE